MYQFRLEIDLLTWRLHKESSNMTSIGHLIGRNNADINLTPGPKGIVLQPYEPVENALRSVFCSQRSPTLRGSAG